MPRLIIVVIILCIWIGGALLVSVSIDFAVGGGYLPAVATTTDKALMGVLGLLYLAAAFLAIRRRFRPAAVLVLVSCAAFIVLRHSGALTVMDGVFYFLHGLSIKILWTAGRPRVYRQ